LVYNSAPVTGGHRIADVIAQLPRTRAALLYAQRQHAGQRRSDGAPFIAHPIEVAGLLHEIGAAEHLIAAGLLHDTIEKTDASAAELHGRFGAVVASLVLAVTEDERIAGYRARKAALREQVSCAGDEALTLFAADKVSKARELRLESRPRLEPMPRPPSPDWAAASMLRRRRMAHYQRCLELLDERLGGSPLVGLLRTELQVARARGDRPVLAHAS
jgi:hypothetical protein